MEMRTDCELHVNLLIYNKASYGISSFTSSSRFIWSGFVSLLLCKYIICRFPYRVLGHLPLYLHCRSSRSRLIAYLSFLTHWMFVHRVTQRVPVATWWRTFTRSSRCGGAVSQALSAAAPCCTRWLASSPALTPPPNRTRPPTTTGSKY